MGITFLLKEYARNPLIWWFGFISLHLLGIYYFGMVHGKIFKKVRHTSRKSVIMNLIAVGMGQAYNRQLVKGIVFFVAFVILIISYRVSTFVANYFIVFMVGFYAIVLIDGYRNAFTARRRTLVQLRMKVLEDKTQQLLKYREQNHKFAVDTNILMHEPDLLVYLLENESFDLYMSMTVFNELDGLKNREGMVTRKKAQVAFDVIEEFQRRNKLHLLKTPKTDVIRKYGLNSSSDEKIIGTYLHELHNGHDKLMFLSNDKGARILARNAGMPVVEV